MLQRISIQNFRCLRQLELDLRPLTVLIGPNDTGKSTFLAAIDVLLKRKVHREFERLDHWKGDRANGVVVRGDTGHGTIATAEATALSTAPEEERRVTRGSLCYSDTDPPCCINHGTFSLPSFGPVMNSPGVPDRGPAPMLDGAGGGVPSLLDWMLRRDRKRFDDFVGAVRQNVPGLCEINVGTPDPKKRSVELIIDSGLELSADSASVGLRLMLFFVALTYHPTPPDVILLEEPENGVHPRRLADIMNLLRDVTKGVHCGHPAQVILTTHSPYLLDHVNLDEDQVLVFRRNDDGSRTAEPVNKDRLKTFLDGFMLGEVWFNEQEEGLIKQGD